MVQDRVCPFCEESSAKGTGTGRTCSPVHALCLLHFVVLYLFEGNIFLPTEDSGKVA